MSYDFEMAYVYILENKDAARIKIGATLNHPTERLVDISRMWRTIKGRCQICLCWRMLKNGKMPNHVLSGEHCIGSEKLPFEYSQSLAELKLKELEGQLQGLKGNNLTAAIKRIKNLKKILETYKSNPQRIGEWQLRASFKTDAAYQIEGLTHKTLESYLDIAAPFGEVFRCAADDAIKTIENHLIYLNQDT